MNRNPFDENRPDLRTIRDQFNDPETVELWRRGQLPEQIRLKEESAEKKRKGNPPPAEVTR